MSSPKIPDPNKAAVAGATANAENYPFQYMINQLAQLGGSATVNGKNYDFTGLGAADNARVVSDQMAQTLLDIQKNYGSDYVKQRLADLQRSDPQGYASRQQLFDKILADSQKAAPNAKMSSDLQDLVNQQLTNGGRLTTGANSETEEVQQGVRGNQIASGITLGNAPATQEAVALEHAGESKRGQIQDVASKYLSAGISPDDIQYRQIQQSLSNLGAFMSGQTPEAQFGSLSGAGNGAAPFTTGYQDPGHIDTGSALQGINNANQIYSGQVNWAQSQVNPWLAGLSTLASGINFANNAGLFKSTSSPQVAMGPGGSQSVYPVDW
jgi:hypothetical protein